MVTPCYWGSHWPLARGNSTGSKIDDRIGFTPCHNSVMSWAGTRPEPIYAAMVQTLDSLGRSRLMSERRWTWLIGSSDENDEQLRDRARSFASPPALELQRRPNGFCRLQPRAPGDVSGSLVARSPDHDQADGSLCEPGVRIRRAPRGMIKVKLAGAGRSNRTITPGTAGRSGWTARSARPLCSKSVLRRRRLICVKMTSGVAFMTLRIVLLISLSGLLPGSVCQADEPKGEQKPTFWVIPHTHWEGAVFKTREEYLEMGLANIVKAMRLLREQPSFRFTLDQVAYVRPFLERYPAEEADFRRFLAEGRLALAGARRHARREHAGRRDFCPPDAIWQGLLS